MRRRIHGSHANGLRSTCNKSSTQFPKHATGRKSLFHTLIVGRIGRRLARGVGGRQRQMLRIVTREARESVVHRARGLTDVQQIDAVRRIDVRRLASHGIGGRRDHSLVVVGQARDLRRAVVQDARDLRRLHPIADGERAAAGRMLPAIREPAPVLQRPRDAVRYRDREDVLAPGQGLIPASPCVRRSGSSRGLPYFFTRTSSRSSSP